MFMKIRKPKLMLAIIGFLLVILPLSCGPSGRYTGTYVAIGHPPPQHAGTMIELQEEGEGVWRTRNSEVSFRWSVQGKEIRLHTKEGGIIVGKIEKDTLTLLLPGERIMSFKKSQGY